MVLTRHQRAALAGGAAVRRYCELTGYNHAGQKIWSPEELSILRRVWPDRRQALEELPGRTLGAVEAKARAMGITTRRHTWTRPEVSRLKQMWPRATWAELQAAFPWATATMLKNQVQFLRKAGAGGLLRPKPDLKVTGCEVTDWVLRKAREHNLSLRELDALARTGSYFQKIRRGDRRIWKHIANGVALFGGALAVREPGEAD